MDVQAQRAENVTATSTGGVAPPLALEDVAADFGAEDETAGDDDGDGGGGTATTATATAAHLGGDAGNGSVVSSNAAAGHGQSDIQDIEKLDREFLPPPADPGALRVQVRPGEDARLVFRSVPGLECGEPWRERPVRHAPALPSSDSAATLPTSGYPLSYLDDSSKFMDGNLNMLHCLLRDHSYETRKLEGAKASEVEGWSLFWHSGLLRDDELALLASLAPHQRINKIPGAASLTVKSTLYESYERMLELHGKAVFDFMPETFVLPGQLKEYEKLVETEVAEANVWILKPSQMQKGIGIFLHRAQAAQPSGFWGGGGGGGRSDGPMPAHVRKHIGVASRYIDPPMLLDGLKFDLRLYVLVSSVHPLVVYLHTEGLTRFATQAYDPDAIEERCVHLTNYSVNKRSEAFVKNSSSDEDGVGSKWSLSALRRRLATELGDEKAAALWRQVDDLIVKSVAAAEPTFASEMEAAIPAASRGEPVRGCFQVFGFDVMLDADAKPWLLEVNCDPALGTDSPLDLKIKSKMLIDTFNVVGMPVVRGAARPAETTSPSGRGSRRRGAGGGPRSPDGRGNRASDAAAPTAMPVPAPAASSAEDEMRHWARHAKLKAMTVTPADTTAPSGSAAHTRLVQQWTLHLVNSEYERSKSTAWRRLFPSARSAEYLPILDTQKRPLHALPFDVNSGSNLDA
jgi:hypothetical protein